MATCTNCLRGARPSITGIDRRTLMLEMGGAVIYITPREDGRIDVALNSENLVDGDYLSGGWDGERWIVCTRKGRDLCQERVRGV